MRGRPEVDIIDGRFRRSDSQTSSAGCMAAGILRRPGVRAVVIDRRQLQATIVPQHRGATLDSNSPVAMAEHEPDDVIEWQDSHGAKRCTACGRCGRRWRRRRVALVALTIVALILALLGVVLPGLPTTPFVLVASYGLMRTSRRWHRRLLDSRLFGGVLRDWHLHRGISAHVRAKALTLLTIVVGAACLLAGDVAGGEGDRRDRRFTGRGLRMAPADGDAGDIGRSTS